MNQHLLTTSLMVLLWNTIQPTWTALFCETLMVFMQVDADHGAQTQTLALLPSQNVALESFLKPGPALWPKPLNSWLMWSHIISVNSAPKKNGLETKHRQINKEDPRHRNTTHKSPTKLWMCCLSMWLMSCLPERRTPVIPDTATMGWLTLNSPELRTESCSW